MTGDGKLGVLLVDDETEVTALYEEWLSTYRTFVAHDGREALSVLAEPYKEINDAILDRKMP